MFAREISERDFSSPRERNDLRTPRSQKEERMKDIPTNPLRFGPIGRRRFLSGGASLAAAGVAMPYIGRAAAAEPIKIGMIWAKTGQIVQQAEYLAQGTQLALEQRGNMLLGRPAEIVWLDEPNPQGAQQSAERLVEEHKVVGLLGGALSSFALAISSVAKKSKIPYVAANAAAGSITGSSCNKYTFRLQPPVDVHTRVLAPYCATLGKKWYLLTAAYAFGQDIKKSFTDYITSNGGEVIRRGRSASQYRRLFLLHPEDSRGQTRRRDRRRLRQRPDDVPQAMERTRHARQDSLRRNRRRQYRSLGRRPRGCGRPLYADLVLQERRTTRPKSKRWRPTTKEIRSPRSRQGVDGLDGGQALFDSIEAAKSTDPGGRSSRRSNIGASSAATLRRPTGLSTTR